MQQYVVQSFATGQISIIFKTKMGMVCLNVCTSTMTLGLSLERGYKLCVYDSSLKVNSTLIKLISFTNTVDKKGVMK